MNRPDYEDRLIHVLLEESLGDEAPPDLTARILARAARERRMRVLVPALAAAAVLLVAAVVGWLLLASRYPSPDVSGPCRLLAGAEVGRGAEVATDDGNAALALGGYCRIEMQPQTVLRIEGEKRAEQVFLRRGGVVCDVDRNVGSFAVCTDVGMVSVSGTKFSVNLVEREGGKEMDARSVRAAVVLAVAVMAGSVNVQYGGKSYQLAAGAQQAFGADGAQPSTLPEAVRGFSGQVRGVVVQKGERHTFLFKVGRVLKVWEKNAAKNPEALVGLTITVGPQWVKGDDGKGRPSEAQVAFINKLKVGDEMNLEVRNSERDAFVILELSAEQRQAGEKKNEGGKPAGAEGTVVGILTAKGADWIEVKAEGEAEAKRYVPLWAGGEPKDGGGFDPKMLAAFKTLVVSNLVELKWRMEEKLRVLAIRTIAPAQKEGVVEGTLVAKGENWIDVRPAEGHTERYMARWVGGMPDKGGGFDKEMVQAIKAIEVGCKVRVKWMADERKRVVAIERLGGKGDEGAAAAK